MAFAEIDNSFVRAIKNLHSPSSESQNNIRTLLDEAIKNKYGPGKELGPFFNFINAFQEFPIISGNVFNTFDSTPKDDVIKATDSDSELELDLKEILKEDLLCVVCKGMGVSARNRLVECLDCHNLYHQECHDPHVSNEETDASEWLCFTCKDVHAIDMAFKKLPQSPTTNSTSSHKSSLSNQIPAAKLYEKEHELNSTKLHGSKSTPSSMSSSSSKSTSSSRVITPNINLVSADKRLQIMKKKAAKMQEKRKLSR